MSDNQHPANPPSLPRKDRTAAVDHEKVYLDAGKRWIVGMDEAGYGAWAGPVVVAAVCLPFDDPALGTLLKGVKDSKQMTVRQREAAYETIREAAWGWGIGFGGLETINTQGIASALVDGYQQAYSACQQMMKVRYQSAPDVLLLDGRYVWRENTLPDTLTVERLVKGDTLSLSIAAASVLAKVIRDRKLIELGEQHPDYGFERHKGYGTAAHREAIVAHGVLREVHRTSYKPIAALLSESE